MTGVELGGGSKVVVPVGVTVLVAAHDGSSGGNAPSGTGVPSRMLMICPFTQYRGSPVGVIVGVLLGVGVIETVIVSVTVSLGVSVNVGVSVSVGVGVRVTLGVTVSVGVGVNVAVRVSVLVGDKVIVGESVTD